MAAEGKRLTKTRPARKAAEAAAPAAGARPGRDDLNQAGRPARPSTRKASPGHAIPRRSGSALSLRAGRVAAWPAASPHGQTSDST